MTVQDFQTINPEILSHNDLAVVAEAYLLDFVPCEFCESWTSRQHEWHQYITGSVEICPNCQEKCDTMLRRLIERRRQVPWSNMRKIFFSWKVVSIGLGRIMRRHLVRLAFEDHFECARLVKKWM